MAGKVCTGSPIVSLRPERACGVGERGASGREIACGERDGEQQRAGGGEADGIETGHAVEQALHPTDQGDGPTKAQRSARARKCRTLAQDEARHVGPGGSEREADADFDLASFEHRAFFNTARERIEMHLVSRKSQTVTVGGEPFEFEPGETIHTENSYKYTREGFQNLARQAGWLEHALWTDAAGNFSVRALKAQPGKNIAMDGSSVLVQTLARHDLIDDYYLLVYPVVLGGGKTIFPDGVRLNLRLVDAKPLASGVIVTHYTVDRPE